MDDSNANSDDPADRMDNEDYNKIPDLSYKAYLTEMRGKLYFNSTTRPYGTELWVYDPQLSRIQRLTNINKEGSSHPKDLTVMNGKLYFRASNGKDGTELWVYNPDNPIMLNTNPLMIKNISNENSSSMPDELTEINGKLYFRQKVRLNRVNLGI